MAHDLNLKRQQNQTQAMIDFLAIFQHYGMLAQKKAFSYDFAFFQDILGKVCEIVFFAFVFHKSDCKNLIISTISIQLHKLKEKNCEIYLKVFTTKGK